MTEPYDVLGLPADADDEAIRRRYLELVRQFPRAQAEQVGQVLETLAVSREDEPADDETVRPLVETLVEMHDGLLLAARELTAARDALAEPLPPKPPTWLGRLFPPSQPTNDPAA